MADDRPIEECHWLNQVIAAQARRVPALPQVRQQATLSTVIEADILEHLDGDDPPLPTEAGRASTRRPDA